ncbi:unnamed protein product [Phytophthora fragariaefolia]|uniref:Unnamed protein product n=1 Tax=Phytophthora fragariaefolia TaxID=1490495 RepID=A0A9W6WZX1_9STRA|nr:unnamed protein product [Phytophthora fragariaefolia]
MSTSTTQTTGTPAASGAANPVVAPAATTISSSASSSVVTSTVTTSSSPKRLRSLGEYKKTRGNTVFARDELEALFDVGSDADMEDGKEGEGTSSSRRDDPSVGFSHDPLRSLPTPSECWQYISMDFVFGLWLVLWSLLTASARWCILLQF